MTSTAAVCLHHGRIGTGVCQRCERFGCASCLRGAWCDACLARPAVRLTPSPRAKRGLWLALLGLHGVVFLLPFATWASLREIEAIQQGKAAPAGLPWARGALTTAVIGFVVWMLVLSWWVQRVLPT